MNHLIVCLMVDLIVWAVLELDFDQPRQLSPNSWNDSQRHFPIFNGLSEPVSTFPSLVKFSTAFIKYPEPFLRRHPNLHVLRFAHSRAKTSSSIPPNLAHFVGQGTDLISIFGHGTQAIEHLVPQSESGANELCRYLARTTTIRYLSVEPCYLADKGSYKDTVFALAASSPELTTFVYSLNIKAAKFD
ncbi:hypothetical protein BT96DRAFT_1006736 [Gymnopus androsaceus JB14]|uniref:Uncharacterized protein n=1 Tax=Gymnopus androsaceus JB14 TaxID=1447944 RepID=A0A6A4GK96_9AGAR|nr:hypothetical protein BT96DRAFT_1006736 [Gymnopus androsaceus JB14]